MPTTDSPIIQPEHWLTDAGSATPTFVWGAVAGADNHEIRILRLDGSGEVVLIADSADTTFTTDILSSGSYRVWLDAISAATDQTIQSMWFDFTVADNDDHQLGEDYLLALFEADDRQPEQTATANERFAQDVTEEPSSVMAVDARRSVRILVARSYCSLIIMRAKAFEPVTLVRSPTLT